VQRAILVLNQAGCASVRGIQECLLEVLGLSCSVGTIQAVLAEAGKRALTVALRPRGALAAEADEIFAAGRPVLEVVDRVSGAVLTLLPTASRDESEWGCVLLDLEAAGITLSSLTADGATGLRAGARAAGLAEPHLDHWHTLRALGRTEHLLEAQAYDLLEVAERSQKEAAAQAYLKEHGRRPKRGQPLRVKSDPSSVEQAVGEAEAAIGRADGAAIVLAAVREVLPPLDAATGRVRCPATVTADLGAAAYLLRELGERALEAAKVLELRAPVLVGYLAHLQAALTGPRALLGEEVLAFVAWAWAHRQELGLTDAAEAWPQAREAADQVWAALDSVGRATGMVENLNSILARQRATHRGLPAPFLPVFAVYRNHHVFARGKRAGHSPLELLGLPSPHWLDVLGHGRPTTPDSGPLFPTPSQTVNTLAA
jgi:hypothetical protein